MQRECAGGVVEGCALSLYLPFLMREPIALGVVIEFSAYRPDLPLHILAHKSKPPIQRRNSQSSTMATSPHTGKLHPTFDPCPPPTQMDPRERQQSRHDGGHCSRGGYTTDGQSSRHSSPAEEIPSERCSLQAAKEVVGPC